MKCALKFGDNKHKRGGILLRGAWLWRCPQPHPAGILEHWDLVPSGPTTERWGEKQGFTESPCCTYCASQAELVPSWEWPSPPPALPGLVPGVLNPPAPPLPPQELPKQPQKAVWGWKVLPTSADRFWMELMGKKGILSSCHSPSPRGTAVSPLWGKELEVPSCGCSHAGGQCHQWGQLN